MNIGRDERKGGGGGNSMEKERRRKCGNRPRKRGNYILLHLQLLSSIDSIVLTQCSAKEGRRRSGGRERKEKVFFSTFLFSMLYCAYLKRKYEE